jgi:DNA-binding MarR family transcriptional regulator
MNGKTESLDRSLLDIMNSIDHAYEKFAKATGMSYISMMILDEIYEHCDGCTQKEICEAIHYPKQTVNLVVRSFWEDGLVELREIPSDRRNKTIHLTDKGRKWADGTVGKLGRIDAEATDVLSSEEQKTLVTLTGRYAEAFMKGVEKAISNEDAPDLL